MKNLIARMDEADKDWATVKMRINDAERKKETLLVKKRNELEEAEEVMPVPVVRYDDDSRMTI